MDDVGRNLWRIFALLNRHTENCLTGVSKGLNTSRVYFVLGWVRCDHGVGDGNGNGDLLMVDNEDMKQTWVLFNWERCAYEFCTFALLRFRDPSHHYTSRE